MTYHFFAKIAALSGFIAVTLGAFGAHALKSHFNEYQLDIWQTAVFYQFIHTLLLLFVSKSDFLNKHQTSKAQLICWCLVVGIILFCFSLYLLAAFSIKLLGLLTPIGGFCFLLAWALLFFCKKQ